MFKTGWLPGNYHLCSEQDFIDLPLDPIINSRFNKHTMLWEIIHCHLRHTSDSVMKATCFHKTLNSLPKHFPREKLKHHSQYAIQKIWKLPPKITTVDTNNRQPGELIHVYFSLYNVNSIRDFNSMPPVLCEK